MKNQIYAARKRKKLRFYCLGENAANSPQLACWTILAFGFVRLNHRHHLQVVGLTRYCAMVQTCGLEPQTTRVSDGHSSQLNYICISSPLHGGDTARNLTSIQFHKVLAFSLIELTWSTYIPYPAFGLRSSLKGWAHAPAIIARI